MGLMTATIVKNARVNVETYIAGQADLDYDAAILAQVSVAAGATVQSIPNMDFTLAKLVFLYLISTQDVTLTFTCGTTTKVIALLANVPWSWDSDYVASIPCPFPASPSACTAANAGSVAATLTVRGGVTA